MNKVKIEIDSCSNCPDFYYDPTGKLLLKQCMVLERKLEWNYKFNVYPIPDDCPLLEKNKNYDDKRNI